MAFKGFYGFILLLIVVHIRAFLNKHHRMYPVKWYPSVVIKRDRRMHIAPEGKKNRWRWSGDFSNSCVWKGIDIIPTKKKEKGIKK